LNRSNTSTMTDIQTLIKTPAFPLDFPGNVTRSATRPGLREVVRTDRTDRLLRASLHRRQLLALWWRRREASG